MSKERRVVITGCGVISPLGHTPEELFLRLEKGESAVRMMNEWENVLPAAPVTLSEETIRAIPRSKRRSMGRTALFAALAAQNAAADAGLTADELSSGRTGCVVGSTMGSTGAMEESFRTLLLGNGMTDISPMSFFKCASHTCAFNAANLLNITGMVYSPAAACASGLQAVGIGTSLIRSGMQDVVICGGADEISRIVSGCFELMNAHAVFDPQAPDKASRPFDAHRTGLICGEGAGIVVLEDYEHAKARGAEIHGEIFSYAGTRCPEGISQSDSASILRCIEETYRGTGLTAQDTDYVSAHATSTLQGDLAEAEAVQKFFGSSVPVSSLKGHLGHTLGASGALELIVSLEMMKRGEILPTKNLDEADPACSGLDFVRSVRKKELRTILKNCFAFGGINSTLLFGKTREN